ncbi:hypothetical protein [Nocardia sp. NPDC005998]|uniref:hypothetical protein n=1 Tax=Nocardia sp. NPDC005998 TaxID=3156894 RepID=UPI0033B951DC
MTSPPSLDQVLELLHTPGRWYQPGDVGWVIILGLKDLECPADHAPAEQRQRPPADSSARG